MWGRKLLRMDLSEKNCFYTFIRYFIVIYGFIQVTASTIDQVEPGSGKVLCSYEYQEVEGFAVVSINYLNWFSFDVGVSQICYKAWDEVKSINLVEWYVSLIALIPKKNRDEMALSWVCRYTTIFFPDLNFNFERKCFCHDGIHFSLYRNTFSWVLSFLC